MNTTPAQTKRQSRHAIVEELRREIIGGCYQPGAQFPTRAELETRYGASSVTIQRAIDCLKREDFLEVNGRQGTFVAEHLPHVFQFAMVFTQPPVASLNSRFYTQLVGAASQYCGTEDDPRRITIYYNVDHDHENREYKDILKAAQAHRFAGLIAPEIPTTTKLFFSDLGACADLPKVAFANHEDLGHGWGGVGFRGFADRALDWLRDIGCKRVAVIGPSSLRNLPEQLARRGIETRPYWLHQLALDSAVTAVELAHLVFHEQQDERPDGLFIMDDNLTDHVLRGVLAAGVRVPEDIRIVSHCNFPSDPSPVPVQRIGYPADEAIAAALRQLESQRVGNPPNTQWVPGRFEDELPNGDGE